MSEIVEVTNGEIIREEVYQAVVQMVLDSLTSPESKRKYESALVEFMVWYSASGASRLDKATVQRYAQELVERGMSASSVNLRLSAIRTLAREASDNGLIEPVLAQGIRNTKGIRVEGKSIGNWLTLEQAQALLLLPDTSTVKGLRDRSILAVFLGCGLRRKELAGLTLEHIQKRQGRWVIVDLVGKRNKMRSVPMPSWVYLAIYQYTSAGGIEGGLVFRRVHRTQAQMANVKLSDLGISDQAVYNIVLEYAHQLAERYAEDKIGVIRPHDLRRSFAKLAKQAGGDLVQIQKTLGHSSVQITESYIGEDQNLEQAPGDLLDLHLL